MSRRTAFGACVVVAMLATVAAAVPASGAVSASSAAGGTIRIWTDKDRRADIEKIANAWASRRGVQVEVVEKNFGDIRDQLKTVAAASAPDVIIGAHDWTGQLAADGLVLPLSPKKATLRQFPKYALDAFSYGTAVKRLYGAPVALENVGLVVNTRLATVPKTFAKLEKQALAFKKKSSEQPRHRRAAGRRPVTRTTCTRSSRVSAATSSARTRRGTSTRSEIGVANPVFLKNAPMIDKWNRLGLINSKVDYDTAKNAFLKGQAAFWITGPWEADTLKTSGLQLPDRAGAEDQVPLGAVPRRPGLHGHEVTRTRTASRRSRRTSSASYIMLPARRSARSRRRTAATRRTRSPASASTTPS